MPSDAPRSVPGSSPLRTDERYRPHRDPQVIILVLIVLGTFAVMVGGLGTGPPFGDDNSSDGPVFPFYDYDGEEQPEPEAVTLSADRTVVDPGGTIAFTVVAGDRPVANATVRVDGQSVETDRNGTATVRFETPGDYTARVVEPEADNNTVARLPLRVRRFTVSLSASASETTVVTAEGLQVAVTRADTGEPVTGRVVVDGRTVRTNESGVATLSFDTAGGYELRVEKERTETERFTAVRVPISVERRSVALDVGLSSNRTRVDDAVTATVTRADTGEPVNASVTVANRSVWTGPDGTVPVALDASGTYDVAATAPRTDAVRFTDGAASLRVRPRLVGLDLAASQREVPAGERVTFAITRATTGEPVAGTVELFGTEYVTGADGELRIRFQVPGEVTAVARAPETPRERFLSDRTNLTVVGADYTVTELDAPATAAGNETFTVAATVTNEGNARESDTATYRIGETVVATETVALDPNESTRVEFTVSASDLPPGEYVQTVSVGRDTAESSIRLTVNESRIRPTTTLETRGCPASI
ncbi:CARDB domain-containing protein [Haloarchaeobius salinus]|uniref:CARDB domain-containing protein n=1 Tax=Haloarchaeobius salinus TaxID=1198298 RepID=UPI00210E479A|nr:CARDB domain-containing protein [Haloarchaeobius salinus]